MKSQPFGFIKSFTIAIVCLLISILCINIIDICYSYRNHSTKLKNEASKVATSVALPLNLKEDEVIIDANKIQKSIATGEIIEGTAIEIAIEQEKEIKEAEMKAKEEAEKKQKEVEVYDGLTMDELSAKINKMFKDSYLKDTGKLFASYSLKTGVDPYTAVAIVLLETGCQWNCSKQVKTCNNVGGLKGGPSCNGTSYKSFDTLQEGIESFINVLSKNYYKKGLDTPEKMNKKYAASPTWAKKVNRYIEKIKKI